MEQSAILHTMISNTYTKSDFYRRIGIVEECLEQDLYMTDSMGGASSGKRAIQCATYARDIGRPEESKYIEEWGDETMSALLEGSLSENVDELKHALEDLPELVLYVPFTVKDTDVVEIGTWCREAIDERVILRFVTDPEVVGGCAIAWGGEYRDYSLHYFMRQNRDQVSEHMASYDTH